jgi:hypothetical protein
MIGAWEWVWGAVWGTICGLFDGLVWFCRGEGRKEVCLLSKVVEFFAALDSFRGYWVLPTLRKEIP